MQTDIFLQKTLVEVVKEELKGYVTLNNGEMVEFNVYPQNLPAKQGKNDKDHFPYVLVCLDEETIAGEDSAGMAVVSLPSWERGLKLVGIQDQNPNRQGHFDVANVLNKLQDRFLKDRLIDQRYRIQFPITKKFQEEDTWPKFIGGMSTLWDVSKMEMRETEYD